MAKSKKYRFDDLFLDDTDEGHEWMLYAEGDTLAELVEDAYAGLVSMYSGDWINEYKATDNFDVSHLERVLKAAMEADDRTTHAGPMRVVS